ncbi:peptidoglycan-binding protein [Adhaeribacter sp. BT258]|uniref:Peptidoglycan-binding protein n=1 Tax=Adhaeribacter terrigena TaxID=2793070 RepID=A0ABS1C1Q6_9BACT|nr:peptidoglycan-binding protein [Adhaeribacter terrigena]MBK0403321.1 peptidoglycan-binding protein [Adhaeribacter terrigena]
MQKTHYLKELQLAKSCSLGSRGPDVKRIQEWLNLWAYKLPTLLRIKIDGDFGPATAAAVIAFKKTLGISPEKLTSQVNADVFAELTKPIKQAFTFKPQGLAVRKSLLLCAEQHLQQNAREIGFNEGPWVRSYMNGQEGKSWPWCMGFVQTVFDQALSFSDKKYTDFMPATFSCDVLGQHALKQKNLLRNKDLKRNSALVKPGDLFLVSNTSLDWTHTGIIEKVEGNIFYTLEGNTNLAGSREGVAVMRRLRNFHTNPLDVIRFPELG